MQNLAGRPVWQGFRVGGAVQLGGTAPGYTSLFAI
jgi:hypothetical protein